MDKIRCRFCGKWFRLRHKCPEKGMVITEASMQTPIMRQTGVVPIRHYGGWPKDGEQIVEEVRNG